MKKYIPSIQNNNDLKLDIISDLAALIYKLNNNKYNQSISKEIINR